MIAKTSDMKSMFDFQDVSTAITGLSLTTLLMGEFLVIMNSKPDVIVFDEPYLSLMILVEKNSGRYIRRIWNRTVGKGKIYAMDKIVELCKKHFFQGRPCLGSPQNEDEEDDKDFLITQTPIARKISKFCHEVLGSNAKSDATACHECLKLGDNRQKAYFH